LTFEHLQSAADDGITRKQHTCVQAFVCVNGKTLLNVAFGECHRWCIRDRPNRHAVAISW